MTVKKTTTGSGKTIMIKKYKNDRGRLSINNDLILSTIMLLQVACKTDNTIKVRCFKLFSMIEDR